VILRKVIGLFHLSFSLVMSPPAWKWCVSFSEVQDLDSEVHGSQVGELHLWTATDWLVLMNSKGTPIVGKYLQDGDTVDIGSEIEFSAFHAKVIGCVLSPNEDLIASDQDLLNMMVSDPRSADQCWKVTYSTHVDLARGRMKAYDGSLMLSVKDNWLVLKNAKVAMIG
jgi:hypothetical protein